MDPQALPVPSAMAAPPHDPRGCPIPAITPRDPSGTPAFTVTGTATDALAKARR